MIKLMYVTADPNAAQAAWRAGVDRIFVDLEYINKAERQRGRDTLISHNTIDDVARVRAAVPEVELLVRVNPVGPSTAGEVDAAVGHGADVVMLPMVMDAEDAQTFIDWVGGRARTCLLLETAQALARLDSILDTDGVDEMYVGLNDMHISMGLDFMFELLSGGLIDYMAQKAHHKGLPFGFGGMARIGEGALPAEMILGEHYRLGSTSVILSRTFRGEVAGSGAPQNIEAEVGKLREYEQTVVQWDTADFEANRLAVVSRVAEILAGQ